MEKDLAVENSFAHIHKISTLMKAQRFAVLSTTQDDGQPYSNLVAFSFSEDLQHVIFCTLRSTKKFENLRANSNLAMLIDNRRNEETDLEQASALTVLGSCEEIHGELRSKLASQFLSRHKGMADFVNSPDCALMRVGVSAYYLVTKFQNIIEINF